MCCREDEGKAASELALVVFVVVVVAEAERKEGRTLRTLQWRHIQRTLNAAAMHSQRKKHKRRRRRGGVPSGRGVALLSCQTLFWLVIYIAKKRNSKFKVVLGNFQ